MGAFNTIQLRPHLLQYFINEWWYALLCIASFAIAGMDMVESSTVHRLMACFGIMLVLYLYLVLADLSTAPRFVYSQF